MSNISQVVEGDFWRSQQSLVVLAVPQICRRWFLFRHLAVYLPAPSFSSTPTPNVVVAVVVHVTARTSGFPRGQWYWLLAAESTLSRLGGSDWFGPPWSWSWRLLHATAQAELWRRVSVGL